MSRRGVAAMIGKPESTIRAWVERGMAYPDVEPYGSFSAQYRQAERSLEAAAAGTVALFTQRMFELSKAARAGDFDALVAISKAGGIDKMLDVLASRFPESWGQSKHRQPEPEHSADNFLEQHALTHEQMRALFRDPPAAIEDALYAEADVVYARLVARGFEPGKERQPK